LGCRRDAGGKFVALRTVSQTLAQRSQCHLLLNQPAQALEELTLLHDLRPILHGPPTNRPMSLVTAMIDVALAGVYASVVEDGLRLQSWPGCLRTNPRFAVERWRSSPPRNFYRVPRHRRGHGFNG
jgi:hypothetical protein